MTEAPSPFLVTVSGQDGPGIAARLFSALAERGVEVDDVEQVRVHGRLLLCVEADMVPVEVEPVCALLAERSGSNGGMGRTLPASGPGNQVLKYLASGWCVMMASVDCSGASWNSSDSVTPIRPGSSSRITLALSSRSGQAG